MGRLQPKRRADAVSNVINASWHVPDDIGVLRYAIYLAGTFGCVVVAAAGNSGADNMEISLLPASYGFNNMIVAMASDRHDNKCWFSNYGANVDLAAPGDHVLEYRSLLYQSRLPGV